MKITIVTTKETVKNQKILFPTIVVEKDGNTTHIVFAFWQKMWGISFIK